MSAGDKDSEIMKEAIEIHNPDGRDFDVNYLFIVIKNILEGSTDAISTTNIKLAKQEPQETEDKSHSLRYVVDQISSQMSSQTLRQKNQKEKVESLLEKLEPYFWDTKLVLIMAAFALNYAIGFRQLPNANDPTNVRMSPLKNVRMSLLIFRRFPVTPKDIEKLDDRRKSLKDLIEGMMEVTRNVAEFSPLTSLYISMKESDESEPTDPLPDAVYWIIRSVLACVTQMATGSLDQQEPRDDIKKDEQKESKDSVTKEEVDDLKEQLRKQSEYLEKHIEDCRRHQAKVDNDLNFIKVLNIFDTTQVDNTEILKALIPAKDNDSEPLWDGWPDRKVSIDVLIRKRILLVISNLDISWNEIWNLRLLFYQMRGQGSPYRMLWIPIMGDDPPAIEKAATESVKKSMDENLEKLRYRTYYFSVYFPYLIKKEVIRLIKDLWQFRNKTIAVLLESDGNMIRTDAIHMIRIWGANACPPIGSIEQSLWRKETWRLKFLLVQGNQNDYYGNYDSLLWITDKTYIFLYGGDNIKWIRDFTKTAREVATTTGINLEMLYVGTWKKKPEELKPIVDQILEEKLTRQVHLDYIRFFWLRLESMLSSMISMINLDKQDLIKKILPEINNIYSYEKDGGWVLLSNGDNILVNGNSSLILRTLKESDQWKDNVSNKGFDTCFTEYYSKLLKEDDNGDGYGGGDDDDGDEYKLSPHPCQYCRFSTIPDITIPESMKCPVCPATMKRQITLRWCNKE